MLETFDLKTALATTTEADDMENFVIEEILPYSGILTICGQAKSGKTFFTQNLAINLALGKNFFDFKINNKQRVLYVNSELNERNLRGRFRKIAKTMDMSDKDYYINCCSIKTSPELYNIDKFAKKIIDKYKKENIDILIIDPIYVFLENENDNSVLLFFLNKVMEIEKELKCSVILVHHKGKSTTKVDIINRGCGASVLGRYVDTVVDLSSYKDDDQKIINVEVAGRYISEEQYVFKTLFNNGTLMPYLE